MFMARKASLMQNNFLTPSLFDYVKRSLPAVIAASCLAISGSELQKSKEFQDSFSTISAVNAKIPDKLIEI